MGIAQAVLAKSQRESQGLSGSSSFQKESSFHSLQQSPGYRGIPIRNMICRKRVQVHGHRRSEKIVGTTGPKGTSWVIDSSALVWQVTPSTNQAPSILKLVRLLARMLPHSASAPTAC